MEPPPLTLAPEVPSVPWGVGMAAAPPPTLICAIAAGMATALVSSAADVTRKSDFIYRFPRPFCPIGGNAASPANPTLALSRPDGADLHAPSYRPSLSL